MTGKPSLDGPDRPQIPRPPTKEEQAEMDRARSLVHDDWTGDGPKPGTSRPRRIPDGLHPFLWNGPIPPWVHLVSVGAG
ncbi:hypothetical protein HHL28_09525 [Aerophototrophica crusticola]|uniref:Uncharacterized protein n=1 Tax=Aerophototrophica crusticola TaxID=1709002 RepID=A0A858R7D4_9PROT|nr:hypothetical protein HHL28_09525 [Rhodospirillaceae bacterium B3]